MLGATASVFAVIMSLKDHPICEASPERVHPPTHTVHEARPGRACSFQRKTEALLWEAGREANLVIKRLTGQT
jgi:hypothetical protein